MTQEIRQLEPKALWNCFADLNAIPRASKKEDQVISFVKSFGEKLGLETIEDSVGNVIIRKPGTIGYEHKSMVILQSHLDMVHQKNASTQFDFDREGIKMFIENDWVKADGTTLGADNGIGVASIMALLASDNIPHPPLEALFTIDEETGMTGALGLKGGLLKGSILLNLDTEDDDELTIGCAGGVDITGQGNYELEDTADEMTGFRLIVRGLTGGHSGMDIHRGRGNANKLMNRLLYKVHELYGVRISHLEGGSLRNAIPRESFAILAVPINQQESFKKHIADSAKLLKKEYHTTDPNLAIELIAAELPKTVMQEEFQDRFIASIYSCPNGIYRMSPDIDGLVQTSNNIARIVAKDGEVSVMCLARSSSDTEKVDIGQSVSSSLELGGLTVTFSGSYPGWQPKPESEIVTLMRQLYGELFRGEPKVLACHAGLECGILGTHYPHIDMVSFGPNIKGAHSPDERVQISSVQKFWGYLLETLKRIS
ncbi:MAG: hypothetical protein RL226_1415 [Bacteroidota bacterium]